MSDEDEPDIIEHPDGGRRLRLIKATEGVKELAKQLGLIVNAGAGKTAEPGRKKKGGEK